MTDTASPPCDGYDDLPAPKTRVMVGSQTGVVQRTDPARGVLVLRDRSLFADWFAPHQVTEIPDPDEDDGFGEHDEDDAIYDARREDALEAEPLPAVPGVTPAMSGNKSEEH